MLSFGLGIYTDQVLLMILPGAVSFPIWALARRLITQPRLGHVNFRPARVRRETKRKLGLTVTGTFTFLLGIVVFLALQGGPVELRHLVKDLRLLPLGFALTLGFLAVGVLYSFRRFYIYAGTLGCPSRSDTSSNTPPSCRCCSRGG